MVRVTHCPVLAGDVAALVDMEGFVNRVICPHFDAAHSSCRSHLSQSSNGPLGRLLAQATHQNVADHAARCQLLSRHVDLSDARS